MSTPNLLSPALIEQVFLLDPPERQKLVDRILDTEESEADDPEIVRQEWNAEIKRRIEGYLDGSIPTLDAKESFLATQKRFREKHAQ